MAAIRRVQGRAVCEPDEVDRLSTLFCGWLALAFWSMLQDWHADPAQRARLAQYVSAAAHLARLRHDAATYLCAGDSSVHLTLSYVSLRLPDYMATGRGRDVRLFFRAPARGHEMHWDPGDQASRHHARK
jgi:hypothetical protein